MNQQINDYVQKAELAEKQGDLEKAIDLYGDVADLLYLELGDSEDEFRSVSYYEGIIRNLEQRLKQKQ